VCACIYTCICVYLCVKGVDAQVCAAQDGRVGGSYVCVCVVVCVCLCVSA